MALKTLRLRILAIDDDEKMNDILDTLSGHGVSDAGRTIKPEFTFVHVEIEPNADQPGKWRIARQTLDLLDVASRQKPYDLVMVDYGFADAAVKRMLWERQSAEKDPQSDHGSRSSSPSGRYRSTAQQIEAVTLTPAVSHHIEQPRNPLAA
jgi:hypothetical protein